MPTRADDVERGGADDAGLAGTAPVAARGGAQMEQLPVSLAALYDKVNRTEPAVLRALVQGSAARLAPVMAQLEGEASLAGWRLRILDGNHLPASQKRLAPLRDQRGAALPGHTLVVYDPDQALVTDIVACEDAHESERPWRRHPGAPGPGGRAVAGRQPLLHPYAVAGLAAGASRLHRARAWESSPAWPMQGRLAAKPGQLRDRACCEQVHRVSSGEAGAVLAAPTWCPSRSSSAPTERADQSLRLWSNLPAEASARPTLRNLYRKPLAHRGPVRAD